MFFSTACSIAHNTGIRRTWGRGLAGKTDIVVNSRLHADVTGQMGSVLPTQIPRTLGEDFFGPHRGDHNATDTRCRLETRRRRIGSRWNGRWRRGALLQRRNGAGVARPAVSRAGIRLWRPGCSVGGSSSGQGSCNTKGAAWLKRSGARLAQSSESAGAGAFQPTADVSFYELRPA